MKKQTLTRLLTPFVISSSQPHNNIPNTIEDNYYSLTEDHEMVECFYGVQDNEEFSDLFQSEESFLNLPNVADNDSLLDFIKLKNGQQNDAELLASQARHP